MAYQVKFADSVSLAEALKRIKKEATSRGFEKFYASNALKYLENALQTDPSQGEPFGKTHLLLGKHPIGFKYVVDDVNQIVQIDEIVDFFTEMPRGGDGIWF